MNKEAAIAFYIKNGAQKLIQYAESTINKKKNKKHPLVDEAIDYQASVTNFIKIIPIKTNFNYFQREILKGMQGKTRSSNVFNNENNIFLQDIHSFKVLYNKYLNPPKSYIDNQKQSEILRKNIEASFGYKIFNQQFQTTETAQSLRQISKTINQIKNKCKLQSSQQIMKKIELNLLKSRSERLNYCYLMQQSDEMQKIKNGILSLKPVDFQNIEQSEQICGKIINETINRWFHLVLESINMKDLMNSPTIIVEWENSLIQKEKHQIMAQQINGKMLFQYQQKINNLKIAIKAPNSIKQSQLRQKKSVLHSFSQNLKIDKEKTKAYKEFEEIRSLAQKNTQKPIETNKSYQKMANRIQNLKNRQHSQINNLIIQNNNQITNIKQITKPEKIPEVNLPEKQAHRYKYLGVKPSPLRPQNLSKFKLKSKDKSSQLPSINHNFEKLNINAPNRPKNNAKIQIKFPIKIQNFEMQSWTSSFLCYRTQRINLKQLPLMFMKDRHKYGQNRVKIEYPCSPQEKDVEIVYKSMQILNCLGAEVFCEQQISYKTVNQIDSIQILAMSWLLEKPVKQIIDYYGQFYAGCSTKK